MHGAMLPWPRDAAGPETVSGDVVPIGTYTEDFTSPSHLVFCENIACEPHYCSCIRALNSVIAGPIVAFSVNLDSIICNEAPLWHFLPTSFAECFR